MGCNRCRSRVWLLALAAGFVSALAACGSRPPPVAATASAPAASAAPAPMPVARPLTVNHQTWTAEAMEALLAPIALYPDPVLSQVLMAATNPQEVLDAGNWLIDHPNLADKALDQAAAAAGFTPPMRALMQFRQVVDQMCLKMGWTAELGQAFTNDQAGVLAAVQRLRRQAQEAGNLQDSPQMAVETQDQGGQDTIVISPPSPQVVYVPQYDPMTAYAPAPEIETESDGTGEMVATGVLAYGAGLIVGNVFDHDADNYYHHRYYYPNYVYGRYPPCPRAPVPTCVRTRPSARSLLQPSAALRGHAPRQQPAGRRPPRRRLLEPLRRATGRQAAPELGAEPDHGRQPVSRTAS